MSLAAGSRFRVSQDGTGDGTLLSFTRLEWGTLSAPLVESTAHDLNGDPGPQPDRKRTSQAAPALSFPPVKRERAPGSFAAVITVSGCSGWPGRRYHSVTRGRTRRMSPGLLNQVELIG